MPLAVGTAEEDDCTSSIPGCWRLVTIAGRLATFDTGLAAAANHNGPTADFLRSRNGADFRHHPPTETAAL